MHKVHNLEKELARLQSNFKARLQKKRRSQLVPNEPNETQNFNSNFTGNENTVSTSVWKWLKKLYTREV